MVSFDSLFVILSCQIITLFHFILIWYGFIEYSTTSQAYGNSHVTYIIIKSGRNNINTLILPEVLAYGWYGSLPYLLSSHYWVKVAYLSLYIIEGRCILSINNLLQLNELLLYLNHLIHALLYLCRIILQISFRWQLVIVKVVAGWTSCWSAWFTFGWLYYYWGLYFYWRFKWFIQQKLYIEEYVLFASWEIVLKALSYLFNSSLKAWRVGQLRVTCPTYMCNKSLEHHLSPYFLLFCDRIFNFFGEWNYSCSYIIGFS